MWNLPQTFRLEIPNRFVHKNSDISEPENAETTGKPVASAIIGRLFRTSELLEHCRGDRNRSARWWHCGQFYCVPPGTASAIRVGTVSHAGQETTSSGNLTVRKRRGKCRFRFGQKRDVLACRTPKQVAIAGISGLSPPVRREIARSIWGVLPYLHASL